MGKPGTVTFIRSAAKPFQLIPGLLAGTAEHFGFTEKEIALACASHSGEDIHTSIAQQMLDKIGLHETDLGCGTHLPFFEKKSREMIRTGERPTQLHNNCSGKHVAMLAFAKKTGVATETYLENSHPIQRQIVECMAEFAEIDMGSIGIGVDGCSAPNFAMPVSAMAKSFLRLVAPPAHLDSAKREACGRIVNAMIKHPEVIGGTGGLQGRSGRCVALRSASL
jgi:L-asparaginase II